MPRVISVSFQERDHPQGAVRQEYQAARPQARPHAEIAG